MQLILWNWYNDRWALYQTFN